MKIALIAAPYIAVPPVLYGGAERRIDTLTQALQNEDIDVSLFASGDSKPKVPLKPICSTSLTRDPSYDHKRDRMNRIKEINHKTLQFIEEGDYDLINTHDYENPDLIQRLSETGLPILVSIRHSLTPIIQDVYNSFNTHPNINFHGVSQTQVNELDPEMPFIHHGENPKTYEAVRNQSEKRPYFLSIGDMKPIKGHRKAIDLARKSGLDVVISGGSLYYPESEEYFETQIRPEIDEQVALIRKKFLEEIKNGKYEFGKGRVINFGSSTDKDKGVLYKHAQFMPFLGNLEVEGNLDACPGTILESLLSGTPVLGIKGSVSEELVKENVLGINVSSIDEAASRIEEILKLNSKDISALAKRNHSPKTMAQKYINLYYQILQETKSTTDLELAQADELK